MVRAAAERGWLDGDRAMAEAVLSIRRAGAGPGADLRRGGPRTRPALSMRLRPRHVPLLPAAPDWLREVPAGPPRAARRRRAGELAGGLRRRRCRRASGSSWTSTAPATGCPSSSTTPTVLVGRRPPTPRRLPDGRRAGGACGSAGPIVGVPRLADALAALADVPVMVEIKNRRAVRRAARAGRRRPARRRTRDRCAWPRSTRGRWPGSADTSRTCRVPRRPAACRTSPCRRCCAGACGRCAVVRTVQPAAVSYGLRGHRQPRRAGLPGVRRAWSWPGPSHRRPTSRVRAGTPTTWSSSTCRRRPCLA